MEIIISLRACFLDYDTHKPVRKHGREALLEEISKFYDEHGVKYERVVFDFDRSKNVGLVSQPEGV